MYDELLRVELCQKFFCGRIDSQQWIELCDFKGSGYRRTQVSQIDFGATFFCILTGRQQRSHAGAAENPQSIAFDNDVCDAGFLVVTAE